MGAGESVTSFVKGDFTGCGTSTALACASRAGDSATGLGSITSSDDPSFAFNELFDSDRERDLRPRLNPEEFRLSIVLIRVKVRRPVLEGEGDAGRPEDVAGGVTGGVAGEAMRRK